jgi:hypothetical protein
MDACGDVFLNLEKKTEMPNAYIYGIYRQEKLGSGLSIEELIGLVWLAG